MRCRKLTKTWKQITWSEEQFRNRHCHWYTHSRSARFSYLIWQSSYFDLDDSGIFHWRFWRSISGSYRNIQDLLPFTTFSKSRVLPKSFLKGPSNFVSSCLTKKQITVPIKLLLLPQKQNELRWLLCIKLRDSMCQLRKVTASPTFTKGLIRPSFLVDTENRAVFHHRWQRVYTCGFK